MKQMLTRETPGVKDITGVDLAGKVCVLKATSLGPRYQKPQFQLFQATGGFGCNPVALGRAVMGHFLHDDENSRFDRFDFIGYVEEDFAKQIMAEKVSEEPFDPTLRGYLVATNEGTWAVNETLAGCLKTLHKQSFNPRTMKAWRCHPEAWVNEMGGVHFPEGTEWEEIK